MMEQKIQIEVKQMGVKFNMMKEEFNETFEELQDKHEQYQEVFKLHIKQAFENFQNSMEMETHKKTRQTSDIINQQKQLMVQCMQGDRSFSMFNQTTKHLCDQIQCIYELFKTQNSLNFAEESDKRSISLIGADSADKLYKRDEQPSTNNFFMKGLEITEQNASQIKQ